MSNGLISIMDFDENYAVLLADYFRKKSGLGYDIKVFTELDALIEFSLINFSDILIISEEFISSIDSLKNIGSIFILFENSILHEETNYKCQQEYESLYKYQSSENIIHDVMAGYANIPQKHVFSNFLPKSSKIISVYSPIKRCGKTSFSLTLGCLLARNESALYINFEEYSGFSFFSSREHLGDLSDLLYFYKQNKNNLDKKLLSLSHTLHQLNYIPPMRFSLDLRQIDSKEWVLFINDIVSLGRYSTIILDLSDCIKDVTGLLDISDTIYMPIVNDGVSVKKVADFYGAMKILNQSDTIEKITELTLPEQSYDPAVVNNMEQLLFGSMGRYVQTLISGGTNNI